MPARTPPKFVSEEDSDDDDSVPPRPTDRKVQDPKQNGINAKVFYVVIMALFMALLINALYPQIKWCAGYLKGVRRALWKFFRKQTGKTAQHKSWLTFLFKLVTVPCALLCCFGKTKANESSLFPLVMTLPVLYADFTTTSVYFLFMKSIVGCHDYKLLHFLLGCFMMDNTYEIRFVHFVQALVSFWYFNKGTGGSWVDAYTNQIVQFLEKVYSKAREEMGRFSTQDVFGYLQDQMRFGVKEIVYDDKTKELGYKKPGRGSAPNMGARGKSPRRSR
jgi:hypothetical protein